MESRRRDAPTSTRFPTRKRQTAPKRKANLPVFRFNVVRGMAARVWLPVFVSMRGRAIRTLNRSSSKTKIVRYALWWREKTRQVFEIHHVSYNRLVFRGLKLNFKKIRIFLRTRKPSPHSLENAPLLFAVAFHGETPRGFGTVRNIQFFIYADQRFIYPRA